MTIAALLGGLVFAAVAGRQLSTATEVLTGELAYSILGAVAVWIGLPIVAVLAFITVVGIPLGLGLLVLRASAALVSRLPRSGHAIGKGPARPRRPASAVRPPVRGGSARRRGAAGRRARAGRGLGHRRPGRRLGIGRSGRHSVPCLARGPASAGRRFLRPRAIDLVLEGQRFSFIQDLRAGHASCRIGVYLARQGPVASFHD